MPIEKLKAIPFVRALYRAPGVAGAYHFALAFLGAFLCGFPSRDTKVIGVTGTKGKTTVLELINAVFEARGERTALLSSTTAKVGDVRRKNESDTTMPGRFFIQRFLRDAARARCSYAFVEVTSEGIAQHRHRFIHWSGAVFVNLHKEHIEAHGSFEKYRAEKLKFIRYAAKQGATIFINKDDASAPLFEEAASGGKLVGFGVEDVAHLAFEHTEFFNQFNRLNAASALAVSLACGIPRRVAEDALSEFPGLPGRMEFIQRKPFSVVVDYAHTPDSLEAVYKALRSPHPKSHVLNPRLICVLGSAGGGRDKWKRPIFGKLAAEYCDEVILTNEDPYDENPREILEQIESGFSRASNLKPQITNTHKVLEREEAIGKAISLAKDGDTVIITGKGSEMWIHEAGGKKVPWNEREVVEKTLQNK